MLYKSVASHVLILLCFSFSYLSVISCFWNTSKCTTGARAKLNSDRRQRGSSVNNHLSSRLLEKRDKQMTKKDKRGNLFCLFLFFSNNAQVVISTWPPLSYLFLLSLFSLYHLAPKVPLEDVIQHLITERYENEKLKYMYIQRWDSTIPLSYELLPTWLQELSMVMEFTAFFLGP